MLKRKPKPKEAEMKKFFKKAAHVGAVGAIITAASCINPIQQEEEIANGGWQPIMPPATEWVDNNAKHQPQVENGCEGCEPAIPNTITVSDTVQTFPWMARVVGQETAFNSMSQQQVINWQTAAINRWNNPINDCDARLEELKNIYPKGLSHWNEYIYIGPNDGPDAMAKHGLFRSREDDCIAAINARFTNLNGGIFSPMAPIPVMKRDGLYEFKTLLSTNPERWLDAWNCMEANGIYGCEWDEAGKGGPQGSWRTKDSLDPTLDSNSLSGDYEVVNRDSVYYTCNNDNDSLVDFNGQKMCKPQETTSIRENPRVIPVKPDFCL